MAALSGFQPTPKPTTQSPARAIGALFIGLFLVVGGFTVFGRARNEPQIAQEILRVPDAPKAEGTGRSDADDSQHAQQKGARQATNSRTEPTAADPAPQDVKPIGLLSVLSTPSGATVELDGGYIGTTPLILKHDFTKRTYRLAIMLDGFRKWERSVHPEPKLRSISVVAELEPEAKDRNRSQIRPAPPD